MEHFAQSIFFKEGRSARKTGIKRDDCPYANKEMKFLWLSGWDSENEKQKRLGGKRANR